MIVDSNLYQRCMCVGICLPKESSERKTEERTDSEKSTYYIFKERTEIDFSLEQLKHDNTISKGISGR